MTNNSLGYVISWKSPSSARLDTLRNAMRAAGLDDGMAKDFSPECIMGRVLRQMRKERVIHKLKKENEWAVFQLNKIALKEGSEEVHYPLEATVRLNTRTGSVYSSSKEVELLASDLYSQYDSLRLANDITRIVQRLFDQHKGDLIPIREQGGAYFVPHQHANLVHAVRCFMQAIGGRLNILAVTLGDRATDDSVAVMLSDYLAGHIKEFREACQDVTSKTRTDAVERRFQAVSDLHLKLSMYRDLLQEYAKRVDDAINSAEKFLAAKLADQFNEPPSHRSAENAAANDRGNDNGAENEAIDQLLAELTGARQAAHQ